MSAVAELTDAQRQELQQDLLRSRGELQEQLQRTEADSKPVQLDQQMVGRLSRMDAMQQQQMAAATVTQVKAHLKRVALALAAIEAGDFGYCRKCDEPIAFPRLKVRPDSPLCIRCQQANEQ
jgi:DnaK suppressor protein